MRNKQPNELEERKIAIAKDIDRLHKKYTENERSKIIFSSIGALASLGGVWGSAVANVRNRSVFNTVVLLVCAVFSVISGLSLYNGFFELSEKNKEFNEILEDTLNTVKSNNKQSDEDKNM